MRHAHIGDIIEIPTKLGLAYAQYTHKNPKMGSLLRVFDIQLPTRPTHFSAVIAELIQFSTFIPLGAIVDRGIFRVIAHQPVLEANRAFPIFKSGVRDPRTNVTVNWWLWDGENEWQVGKLADEQTRFPVFQIVNDTMLVRMIETGWRAEDEF